MPMSDTDLENMRTMVTAAMQTMGRSLEDFNKKAKESAGASGGFGQLNSLFVGMTKNLVGPIGLVAGVYAAAKSLQEFAANRVQLQMLSTDLGFSTRNMSLMKNTMEDMGLSGQAATGVMTALGGQLKQLATLKVGSPLLDQLNAMGEGKFAANLLKVVETGDFDAAMKMIVKKYESMSTEARTYLAVNVLGIPESVLQNYTEFSKKVKESFEGSYQHSKDYLHNMNQFERDLRYQWERIKEIGVGSVVSGQEAGDKFRREGFTSVLPGVPDWLPKNIKPGLSEQIFGKPSEWPLLRGFVTPEEPAYNYGHLSGIGQPESKWQKLKRLFSNTMMFSGADAVRTTLDKTEDAIDWATDPNTPIPSEHKSSLLKLHEWSTREELRAVKFLARNAPDVTGSSGRSWLRNYFPRDDKANFADRFTPVFNSAPNGKDLIEIENDSNKLLRDVRDSLLRMETGSTGSGGGEGGSGGGGRRSLGTRLGIEHGSNRGGEGAANSDYTPSGEPVAGLKQDRERFRKELENDPGLKTELFKHMVGENNNPLAQQALIETAMNRASERRTSLRAQLPYFQGYRDYNVNQSNVLDKNLAAVLAGSNVSMGSTDNSSNAGTNLAAPGLAEREASSGKFIRRRIINGESMFRPGWAEPKWRDKYPSWAEQRGLNPETGEAYPLGQQQNAKKSYDGNSDEARSAIDKSQQSARIDASMNAIVDFRNIPSWVKTSVDSNDRFKNLKITRSTSQNGIAGSNDTSPWSGY